MGASAVVSSLHRHWIVVAIAALAACAPATPATPGATTADAAKAAPASLRADNAVIIDVRSAEEWADGHAKETTLIPIDELEGRLADVKALVGGDTERRVVIVCRSGSRAGRAQAFLKARGFTNVVNGGAWQNVQ
jgi:phage shock protein E